ncbi:putative Ig domain-containing protein [Nocardioides sp. TRM66260-LWL]|uniref:putative Ig domain-containing protein n=1 Tax=Nocardioides sp. TRM66260-LWL TaxID=2874478 RepID=UPI001CC7A460|nr:putative Ig domain-containing protein [Nocardioides sp. TRM66260-LWL]MBZ5735151.1 putative Ig domain-containing protein [Nocardioides sp. TRM66260-LWL]
MHPTSSTHPAGRVAPLRRTLAGLVLLLPGVAALGVPAPPASAATGAPCAPVLAQPTPAAALEAAGTPIPDQPANPGDAAELTASVEAAAADEASAGVPDELWLDRCGKAFYLDRVADPVLGPQPADAVPAGAATTTTDPVAPLGSTFQLHSRPGAPRTIYLDADGFTLTNTAWNAGQWGGAATVALPAFSMDATPAFSDAEKVVLQNVWAIVAEDYAPFDVDVTTEQPAADALNRTSAADQAYGTRVVITNDTVGQSRCGCGGVAYLGVLDDYTNHDYYQPAFAFTRGLGYSAKNIAEAVSHEAGHTLGLTHQGTSSQGYYGGANGWAPIMGVGYYQPLSQWARGEYAGANNQQDALAVMQGHGATTRADDHGDTPATATALGDAVAGPSRTGVIATGADVDAFSFTLAAPASVDVSVDTSPVAPDLDATLRVLDSTGAQIATSDPDLVVGGPSVVSGTGASLTALALPAGTYYATVEGTGTAAFSDYGSLGTYTLRLGGTYSDAPVVSTTSLAAATLGVPYSATLASSATGAVTWSLASGRLPAGLTLSPAGVLAGRPSAAGSFTVSVKVADARGLTATRDLALRIAAPPTVAAPTPATAATGVAYRGTLRLTGGVAPYTVTTLRAPDWATVSASGEITGTPTQADVATFGVRVVDADGRPREATFTLAVSGPVRVATTGLPSNGSLVAGAVTTVPLAAIGGTRPYTWSGVDLPPGVTIDAGGRLTARGLAVGDLSVTAAVRDATGATATATWAVRVVPALTATVVAPAATVGTAASATVVPSGGTGPYQLSAKPPAGWSFDGGTLSGTPTTAAAVSVPVTIRDADGRQVVVTARITPRAVLTVTTATLPAVTVGRALSTVLRTSGGYGAVSWSVVDGTLPSGLTLSSAGVLAGIPSAPGTGPVTVQARDGEGRTATRVYALGAG